MNITNLNKRSFGFALAQTGSQVVK